MVFFHRSLSPLLQITLQSFLLVVCLILCQACSRSLMYDDVSPTAVTSNDEEYFLVIFVDAYHLNYQSVESFIRSIRALPQKKRNVSSMGHAWIYLYGRAMGKEFSLEGGHSGERDLTTPSYFEGVANYLSYGYVSYQEGLPTRVEPDPIHYLWTEREDGFFQRGSGGHKPTFAAKVVLTKEQFSQILSFIKPSRYPYSRYSLTEWNCCTFVQKVAFLADLHIDCRKTYNIERETTLFGTRLQLWTDTRYSQITIITPDTIEEALIKAVNENRAESFKPKLHPISRVNGAELDK